MGFTTVLQNAANTAINVFGDLKSDATHSITTSATYNSSTGAVGGSTSTVTLTGIFTQEMTTRRDGDTTLIQQDRFLVAGKNITTVPNTQEQLTIGSNTYTIEKIITDPAQAMYQFMLERV